MSSKEEIVMVMRVLKTHMDGQLIIERVMYTKRYSLILDKERCAGCGICETVCPREAIKTIKPVRIKDRGLRRPNIDIDEKKCNYCGVCNVICPFGALSLLINGIRTVPVTEKESFPQLIHQVDVDEAKCPIDCDVCAEACPFNLINVRVDEVSGKVKVDVDREHCPTCRLCEVKCPYDAINVRKIINGFIKINKDKCPQGCRDCIDVCPVPNVLNISADGKVEVDEYCCIYCGVCKIVCPVDEALEIQRTSIHHTNIHSGAWNKALEKLTSTKNMAKELHSKIALKARESVKRRFS
jgi:4Fe-4S ferredoxin